MPPADAPIAAPARRPIRALPPLLAGQIAAGEVVERPASVVKELLENAIDAGATRIRVDLEQGGVELVRVTDDGCGVPLEDAGAMLAPHATSKLADLADLDAIATMGFRGEALASIRSVSRMSVRSRTADDAGAWSIDAFGDDIAQPRPCAGPVGTQISVRNLFCNTPARRKFLRTPATEQTRCVEVVKDAALSHPHIGFVATCDGRTTLDLPPNQGPRERAVEILGRELDGQLLTVSADRFDDARGLALWGLAGLPSIARGTNKAQRFFVNGRPIRDRTIQHALAEAYRGLIEPGRHPTAVLLLEMSPAGVDVNVHPTKSEVRFRDSSMVHQTVLRAVRDALRGADLTPQTQWSLRPQQFSAQEILPTAPVPLAGGAGEGAGGASVAAPTPEAIVDFVKRAHDEASSKGEAIDFDAVREAVRKMGDALHPRSREGSGDGVAQGGAFPLPAPRPADRVLQVHNSFLVTQDESGLVIIDQHALHERVMFETLLRRLETAGSLESQRMLTPAVVRASASEVDRLPDLAPMLTRLGVEAEPLGPKQIAVHAFPTFLFERKVEPEEFLRDLLERADAAGFAAGREEAIHEVLDMMACKAAVKAGDRMSESELHELLAMRDRFDRASNCPHGRPTTIRVPIRELEKRFGRG